MTATQYLNNKDKRTYTPFVVNSGGRFFMEADFLIPEREFYAKYPLAEKVQPESKKLDKGENPDKTKIC